MAEHSDENTIIGSHQSSIPSASARNPDEEIMPRASFLPLRDNNHHLDLDSQFDYRIILEIIRGHPLLQALTRVELVPELYLQQFWHTLRYRATQPPRLTAKIDHFEVKISLRGLRRALDLPYVDNFDSPAQADQLFDDIRSLGYQDPTNPYVSTSTLFRPKNLPPIWYTLCTIINRCMTSKHTGTDKANMSTLQMFHAFAHDLHIDYAILLWNEMVELVNDQTMPSRRSRKRNFVPFQRYFQILIHQAMEDNPNIPRREEHPRGPSHYMHRLHLPKHTPFAHTAVIKPEVLNYADEDSEVVRQYRIANALMDQPEPAGPTHDASPLGSEGPIVEGVQEQGGVPEQREVRQTIRKSVGGSSSSASHKRPRLDTSGAGSSGQPEQIIDAAEVNEGVEADVEMGTSGEDRGRKEMSETVTESEKVLTTDSPQPDPIRVPTSSASERPSPLRIESDMARPAMQCTPPSHSSVSQQAGVSFSTGELAHTLSAAQSVSAGIETGRHLPRPPPFFQSTSSLAPFGSPSILRTPLLEQHQVGGFRAPTGTPRVLPPFVGASRGQGGRPIIANTMPAMNIGHTVSSTAMSTSNLRGLGVSPQVEMDRAAALVGPPPNFFVPLQLMKLAITSISNSFKAHETSMQQQMQNLADEVKRAVKGKGPADTSTPEAQTPTADYHPSNPPLDLASEEELKSKLLARLLAKSDPRSGEDANLISLLQQQTPPPPEASAPTDPQLLPMFDKLNQSISTMADSLFGGFQTLVKRVEVIEQSCGVQAEGALKRRHDDQDDPDHPEGERRTGGIGTSTGKGTSTGIHTETALEKTTDTGSAKTAGASDDLDIVLADVIAAVEKPAASDNRTEGVLFGPTELPPSDTAGTSTDLQPAQQIIPAAPEILILQADERLKDSTLEAALRHLQEIVNNEPRYLATGQRVRIMTPFQETFRRDMFVKDIQQISWEKVYGIEDWPEKNKREYLYFMRYESLNANTVESDKPIRKVLKIESQKLSKVWFPEFTIERSDGSEQVFNEADFQKLKLNDICILYEILSRDTQKIGTWSDAFQSLKRFMKNILKFSYLKDFQMALESRQVKVNIRPPNRHLPGIQGIHAYSVLETPDTGVVYPDSNSKHRFLRISDINKFSDGTFKMIQIHLESRLRSDEKEEQKLTEKDKELVKEVLNAVKYRMEYRNALRRFELIFGIRKTNVDPVFI